MAIGIIGKKLGMTQILDIEKGRIPVTIIEAGPCQVLQKKVVEDDGYNAIQLGFYEAKGKNINKPLQGHFKKSGEKFYRYIKEFRDNKVDSFQPGQTIKVDIFKTGEFVDVISYSKGKGFAGGVKRHHFKGGPATHGSMFHRAPGSIGSSAFPSRVIKGKRLPGHMGDRRVTIQNLLVIEVDKEKNLLILRGSVPGAINSVVYIRRALKQVKQ